MKSEGDRISAVVGSRKTLKLPSCTNGGIGKASTSLVVFGKTGAPEPGASRELTFTFNVGDMSAVFRKESGHF